MEKDFQQLLGGVERNSAGEIVSAKSIMFTFFGKMNGTEAKKHEIGIEDAVGAAVSIFFSSLAFPSALTLGT